MAGFCGTPGMTQLTREAVSAMSLTGKTGKYDCRAWQAKKALKLIFKSCIFD